MKTSEKAKEIMKAMESLSLLPYDDQKGIKSAPIPNWVQGATIGYGHLITRPQWNLYFKGISREQAEALFNNDLVPFEDGVSDLVKRKLTQNEFDALVMLAFNIGLGALKSSSVLKMVNGEKGNYPSLEAAWKAWNKSQGKVMNGLIKRRALEYDIYRNDNYRFL